MQNFLGENLPLGAFPVLSTPPAQHKRRRCVSPLCWSQRPSRGAPPGREAQVRSDGGVRPDDLEQGPGLRSLPTREGGRMEDGSPDFSLLGQLVGRVLTHQPGLPVQQVGVDSLLKQKALMRPAEALPAASSSLHTVLGGKVTDPLGVGSGICFYSPGHLNVQSGWKTPL